MIPPPPRGASEKQFAQAVVDLAQAFQWKVYRTYDSRRSPAGFPDLVLCRATPLMAKPRIVFAELKAPGGRLSAEQLAWLTALELCGSPVEAHEWRPADWPRIVQALMPYGAEYRDGEVWTPESRKVIA